MKSTILAAFAATLFSRAGFSAPVAVSITSPEFGQSGYDSHVGAAPREEELSTTGRSGYNSVGIARAGPADFTTDGRSGYNSVGSAERDVAIDAKTDGRSGYN